MDECPKEGCFHWICPGGAADMSRKTHKDLETAFKEGNWVSFPDGGCSCTWGRCTRIDPKGEDDFFEPV